MAPVTVTTKHKQDPRVITIDYFSDVLCVWAYGGQVRLEEVRSTFGSSVVIRERFMPLFADTRTRIGEGWQDRGGFPGFGDHVREVCQRWPHASVHADVWSHCRPATSFTAHQFLSAASLCLHLEDTSFGNPNDTPNQRTQQASLARLTHKVRCAFFERGQDIARVEVLLSLLDSTDPSAEAIRARMDDGSAAARLFKDAELATSHGVRGSPTYLFNDGRQLLYGNVGYRIIEANIRELLEHPLRPGEPSWC